MKHNIKAYLDTLRAKTLHGICSGVSEGENEVAGRIRFLAKFQKPKAIALTIFALMLISVAAFCLGGDNPIAVTHPASSLPIATPDTAAQATATPQATADADSGLATTAPQDSTAATTHAQYTIWQADLTHDGQDEQIIWDDIAYAQSLNEALYVQKAGSEQLVTEEHLWSTDPYTISVSHAGNTSYSLYQDETGDYLWNYTETWYTGTCYANYTLFYLSPEGEAIVVDSAEIELLTDGMPVNEMLNDVDAILAFYETAQDYASHSYVLVSTLGELAHLDVTTGETQTGAFFSSTEAQPIHLVPSLIVVPQDSSQAEGSATEQLRTQLEELNEKRIANYAEVYAEQNATTIEMVLEGYPEEVAAVRYTFDGYSISIPTDDFVSGGENRWQADNNEDIFFEILCLPEADLAKVAQSIWGAAGEESEIMGYPSRFFWAGGQTSYLQFLGTDASGNYYYAQTQCFDEAVEGWGWRMNYIVDTVSITNPG